MAQRSAPSTGDPSAPFAPPLKGSEEYEAWLDGPMPPPEHGRGAWLGGRSARTARARAAGRTGDGAKGQSGDAQSRMAAASGQPATSVGTGDAATRSVLIAIRDDGNAHDSDRIRAAQALIAMDREGAALQGAGPSPLVALRDTLALLAPHERLAWLQGERIAHMHAEGEAEGGAATG